MSQLFAGIPVWIFFLLFALIYLGYSQTKTRSVSGTRIVVLPVILLALSCYGALHPANSTVLSVLTWLAGIRIAFYFSSHFQHGRGVVLHPDSQYYVVPGSWIPLTLFITVFIAKFTLGYLVGSHAVNPDSLRFILISSAVSGLISGTFVARAADIFQAGVKNIMPSAMPTSAEGV